VDSLALYAMNGVRVPKTSKKEENSLRKLRNTSPRDRKKYPWDIFGIFFKTRSDSGRKKQKSDAQGFVLRPDHLYKGEGGGGIKRIGKFPIFIYYIYTLLFIFFIN
jgi:hypothetical protein